MDCKFTIGQKLVCVGAQRTLPGYLPDTDRKLTHPAKCGIYTVRELTLCPLNNVPLVRVAEICNPVGTYIAPWGRWEIAWDHLSFWPLQDFKADDKAETDISIFKKIIAEVEKEKETAC